jgi:ribosomal protein S20
MAIKGQAKADYMRDYMRRRREALKAGVDSPVRPGKTDAEMEALKAENADLKAALAAVRPDKTPQVDEELEALRRENDDLNVAIGASQNLMMRTIKRLVDENRALKRQPRRPPSNSEVETKLRERIKQLKAQVEEGPNEALRRQITSLKAMVRKAADKQVIVMTRADRMAIVKVLHPDKQPDQAARLKASQLFNALPIIEG